jgi:hypothetical protein
LGTSAGGDSVGFFGTGDIDRNESEEQGYGNTQTKQFLGHECFSYKLG